MQIRIAICEDEYIHRKILLNYTLKLFPGEFCEIFEFSSGEKLLDNYLENLDILLLDIQMPSINGIETAKKIRLFDTNVTIIFITAIPDFMQQGYEVRAFRYLLKPVKYIDFSRHLIQCKNEILDNNKKNISIKEINEERIIIIPINSILYIETECRITLIHSDNKIYKTRESIKSFESSLLKYNFFRCHRAYLVNLSKINSFGKNSVSIKGSEILVSRYKLKELKMKITDILGSLI